jgi:hypothetical protein
MLKYKETCLEAFTLYFQKDAKKMIDRALHYFDTIEKEYDALPEDFKKRPMVDEVTFEKEHAFDEYLDVFKTKTNPCDTYSDDDKSTHHTLMHIEEPQPSKNRQKKTQRRRARHVKPMEDKEITFQRRTQEQDIAFETNTMAQTTIPMFKRLHVWNVRKWREKYLESSSLSPTPPRFCDILSVIMNVSYELSEIHVNATVKVDDHSVCHIEKNRFYERYASDEVWSVLQMCKRVALATGMISEQDFSTCTTLFEDRTLFETDFESYKFGLESFFGPCEYDFPKASNDVHCLHCIIKKTIKQSGLEPSHMNDCVDKIKLHCRKMDHISDVCESIPHICAYDEEKMKQQIGIYDIFLKWILKLSRCDIFDACLSLNTYVHPTRTSKFHDMVDDKLFCKTTAY